MRVLVRLLSTCGPKDVVPYLLPYLRHTSSHIRLEVTNVVIASYVLPGVEVFEDVRTLVSALDPLLTDPSLKVSPRATPPFPPPPPSSARGGRQSSTTPLLWFLFSSGTRSSAGGLCRGG